jgi:uncharacterized protein YndB with AHSA1/START domain
MTGNAPDGDQPGGVGGPGRLRFEGETATIVFRRQLRHSIQDVWAAITEPAQIEAWLMAKVEREDSRGGRLEMEHPNGVRATGRVLEWLPPRIYEYEWNLAPSPNNPSGEASIVRWELSPSEGGTLLVLTHQKLTRPTAAIFVRGLKTFLDRLSAQLDGTALPPPPWVSASGAPATTAGSATSRIPSPARVQDL